VRILQIVLAVGGGLIIWALGLWAVRMLATPQPEDPDPENVVEVAIDYRCGVCGLRLVVTHAADEVVKAPRHCREEMEPYP
jgi:hypothetical protein